MKEIKPMPGEIPVMEDPPEALKNDNPPEQTGDKPVIPITHEELNIEKHTHSYTGYLQGCRI